MTGKAVLHASQAKEIKSQLWIGAKTTALAVEYGLSQATVSNIKTGKQYPEVLWPDGTMGGMPDYRRVALMKATSRDTSIQKRLGESNVPIEPDLIKATIDAFGCTPEELYQRGLKALQEKRTADQLARMEELARNVEEKFKDANPAPPKPVHIDDGSSDPTKQPKMSWDEVKYKAGQLPIVIIADSGDDQDLRDAIATALTISPPSIWHDDKIFLRTVNDIKQRFINYREKLSTGN